MKEQSHFIGTFRAETDTYFSGGKRRRAGEHIIQKGPLQGNSIHLFSLGELKELLAPFTRVTIGYVERALLGDLEKRLAHWVVHAVR